jgi:hypothetical protein
MGVYVVSSDHVGNTEIGNLYRSACVECSSRREDDDYLDPNPALHARRTLVAVTAARALSAAAPTVCFRRVDAPWGHVGWGSARICILFLRSAYCTTYDLATASGC